MLKPNVAFQSQKLFFNMPGEENPQLPPAPTEDEIRYLVSEYNPDCPLNKIVVGPKNHASMHTLRLFAYTALSRQNHSCQKMNLGIYSGPGQGKTTIVKALAETVELPYLFIQSDALESTWQLFQMISELMTHSGTPLVPIDGSRQFIIPPCLVIFDEAHALSKDLRTGGLLNPMESNDGILRTTSPGAKAKTYEINCKLVCWIAATTDPGVLFEQSEAFYTRLSDHIEWADATRNEVRDVVQLWNPELPLSACELVSKYIRNPREAVAFGDKLLRDQQMSDDPWEVCARRIANKIDEHGMHKAQVKILEALGKRPVASNRIHICVGDGCRRAQAEKMYMPSLLKDLDGRGPLVQSTSKGYALTRVGREELHKRNIPQDDDSVLAEMIA